MKTSKWGLWQFWRPDEGSISLNATSVEAIPDDLQLLLDLWQKIAFDFNKFAMRTGRKSFDHDVINWSGQASKSRHVIMVEEYRLVIRPIKWYKRPVDLFKEELAYRTEKVSVDFVDLSLAEKKWVINKIHDYLPRLNKKEFPFCEQILNSLEQAKSCLNRLAESNRQK